MKKMNREEVITEIMDSMAFSKIFNDCRNSDLKKLFIKLAIQSYAFSNNEGGHVKNLKETSYRLSKEYVRGRKVQNYCMYTLYPKQNSIAIDLRVDGNPISSELI